MNELISTGFGHGGSDLGNGRGDHGYMNNYREYTNPGDYPDTSNLQNETGTGTGCGYGGLGYPSGNGSGD